MASTPAKPVDPSQVAHSVPTGAGSEPITARLPAERRLVEDALRRISDLNDVLHYERNAKRVLIITPPAGGFSPAGGAENFRQIRNRLRAGGGEVRNPSAGHWLGGLHGEIALGRGGVAARSPDAPGCSPAQLDSLSESEIAVGFPSLCPALIAEIISPTQGLAGQQKMQEWIGFGAQPGWLTDPHRVQTWVYRPGARDPDPLERLGTLSGKGGARA